MDDKETVHVALGNRSYDIFVGSKVLEKTSSQLKTLFYNRKVAVITDRNVFDHQYENLRNQLSALDLTVELLVVEPGEKTKNWDSLKKTLEWLIKKEISKQDYVVAFGGGVIGDLVGLAASLLRRGVNFVQIPTTLLAQVDSSIGGKTAINSSEAKNVIGSFYQPKIVFCDSSFLQTLDKRQFLSGYSEILKMAMVFDEKFFSYLDGNWRQILEQRQEQISKVITTSLKLKSMVVEKDEQEKGERALLNFGHTFGHAIESFTNYSRKINHGEAVYLGMYLALRFSLYLGICKRDLIENFVSHLEELDISYKIKDYNLKITPRKFVEHIKYDKKIKNKKLKFILLQEFGRPFRYILDNEKILMNFFKEELN